MAKQSWAITPDKNKHQFVVGIDFGHGETSAAYAEIGWEKTAGTLAKVKDINIVGDDFNVIPSAISIDTNGICRIGADAFNYNNDDAELHVCFKTRPYLLKGEAEQLMIRFMKEVYLAIRERVGATLTNSNHVVYIATPSGWDDEAKDIYGQMAKEAGLPIAGVTSESRAAFINAKSSVDSGLPQYVDKGAVVFDMGSSTLDFTYISENNKPLDYGYNCGASRVEKLMYERLKAQNEETISEFEQRYPKNTDALLYTLRTGKEQYYRTADAKLQKTIDFYNLVGDEDLRILRCNYASGELDAYLKEMGYVDEIRAAMIDFKEKHISGKPIHAAFFTGGASRMTFLQKLVEEVWGVKHVYKDQNPSLTISQGIAEAARSDIRSGGKDKVKAVTNKIMSDIDIYSIFAAKLGAKMQEEIEASIGTPVLGFRDSTTDFSLADLESSIERNIEGDMDNIEEWAKQCMEEAFEEATKDIREETSKMMANYSKSSVQMGKLSAKNLQLPELDFDVVSTQIKQLAETLTEKSSEWTDVATGAAIGAVAAFLLGPIGWVAGGLYALWTWLSGDDSEEAKREKAKHKDLNSEQRLKVFNEFNNNWGSICSQIEDAISDSLNDPALKSKVNGQCKPILKNYAEECLRQTRILLD